MTALEIIQDESNKIIAELIAKHDELGMRSTGDWVSELEFKAEESNGHIKVRFLGLSYTEQLEFGRKPGKFPPIAAIQKWIFDKGIQVQEGTTYAQLAFLIARKIARSGTKYFQDGGTDLIESVITEQRVGQVIDRLRDFYITSTTTTLKQAYAA